MWQYHFPKRTLKQKSNISIYQTGPLVATEILISLNWYTACSGSTLNTVGLYNRKRVIWDCQYMPKYGTRLKKWRCRAERFSGLAFVAQLRCKSEGFFSKSEGFFWKSEGFFWKSEGFFWRCGKLLKKPSTSSEEAVRTYVRRLCKMWVHSELVRTYVRLCDTNCYIHHGTSI